jgi:hypothetical protein
MLWNNGRTKLRNDSLCPATRRAYRARMARVQHRSFETGVGITNRKTQDHRRRDLMQEEDIQQCLVCQ